MKQVIFICLLSLTFCLAKPTEPAPPNHETTAEPKAGTVVPPVPAATTQNQTTPKVNNTEVPLAGKNNTTQPIHVDEQNATTTRTDNKTVTKDEKLTPSTDATPSSAPTSTDAAHNKPAEAKPETQTTAKPEENSTAKNETASKTPPIPHDVPAKPAEPTSEEVKHLVQARSFDGPSFMGGIILTLGLLAIGFMGFRYYKAQTERNYHTL